MYDYYLCLDLKPLSARGWGYPNVIGSLVACISGVMIPLIMSQYHRPQWARLNFHKGRHNASWSRYFIRLVAGALQVEADSFPSHGRVAASMIRLRWRDARTSFDKHA